ncbi:MAG: hypothetical protein Q4B50_05205 [Bacillota bacterium]|nr:hypothetical protein [Bacillota bacterium]
MTIKEFMQRFDISRESQVLKWIAQGYIKGARLDPESGEYILPELARPPYTMARAKTADGIYKSIVRACVARRAVLPELYRISPLEFQQYIDQLLEAGIISCVEEDGIPYYHATLKSNDFLASRNPSRFIESSLNSVVAAMSKGMTSAYLEKIG